MSSTDEPEIFSLAESISTDSQPPYEVDPDGDIILFTPETPLIDVSKGNVKGNYARFRVSSRHLALASPYFKGMLKDCWPAGHTLLTKGSVEIPNNDCKPDVLLIILNLIHARLRRVPREITLQQLSDIAVATDFFQCHEVMEMFAGIWIEALRPLVPTSFSEDLKKWIMIACVFKCDDILKQTTKVAMQQGTGPFVASNLPIPKTIKDKIDQAREQYMGQFESIVAARISELLNNSSSDRPSHCYHGISSYWDDISETYCICHCNALQLGLLMRIMAINKSIEIGLSSTIPTSVPTLRSITISFRSLSPMFICSLIMSRGTKAKCKYHGSCGNQTDFGDEAKGYAGKLDILLQGCMLSS